MSYDVRRVAMKDRSRAPGMIGVLAVILAMLVLLGALALASPYARAPGLAAAGPTAQPAAAPAPATSAGALPAEENPGYPMECTAALSDSGAECVFL